MKAKCLEVKKENKSLKCCLTAMTESRDRWKAEVKELKKRLADIEKHLVAEKVTVPVEEKVSVEEPSPTPSKKHAGCTSTGRRRVSSTGRTSR